MSQWLWKKIHLVWPESRYVEIWLFCLLRLSSQRTCDDVVFFYTSQAKYHWFQFSEPSLFMTSFWTWFPLKSSFKCVRACVEERKKLNGIHLEIDQNLYTNSFTLISIVISFTKYNSSLARIQFHSRYFQALCSIHKSLHLRIFQSVFSSFVCVLDNNNKTYRLSSKEKLLFLSFFSFAQKNKVFSLHLHLHSKDWERWL